MEGKTTNRHVFLRMVREVEMSRDWFGSVFVVNLNIPRDVKINDKDASISILVISILVFHFPTDAAHSFFRNYTPYRATPSRSVTAA